MNAMTQIKTDVTKYTLNENYYRYMQGHNIIDPNILFRFNALINNIDDIILPSKVKPHKKISLLNYKRSFLMKSSYQFFNLNALISRKEVLSGNCKIFGEKSNLYLRGALVYKDIDKYRIEGGLLIKSNKKWSKKKFFKKPPIYYLKASQYGNKLALNFSLIFKG